MRQTGVFFRNHMSWRLIAGILTVAMLCGCGSAIPDNTSGTTAASTEVTTEAVQITTAEATVETTIETTAEVTTAAVAETEEALVTEATEEAVEEVTTSASEDAGWDYVLNTSSKKFHYPNCHSAKKIKDSNKAFFLGTRDALIAQGYSPCGNCHP